MSTWYYRKDDIESGPVSFAELRALAAAGKLADTHLVRRQDQDQWEKAYRVVGLFVEAHDGPGHAAKESFEPAVAAASSSAMPPSSTASDQASAALDAALADARDPKHRPTVPWWRQPLDWVELTLIGVIVALLIGACVYQWIENQPERFPRPRYQGGPTATERTNLKMGAMPAEK